MITLTRSFGWAFAFDWRSVETNVPEGLDGLGPLALPGPGAAVAARGAPSARTATAVTMKPRPPLPQRALERLSPPRPLVPHNALERKSRFRPRSLLSCIHSPFPRLPR